MGPSRLLGVVDRNNPAIARAFNVAAFSPSGDPVIDVTPLFPTSSGSSRCADALEAADSTQADVPRESVSFPENVNVEVTQTSPAEEPAGPGAGGRPRGACATARR